MEKDLIEKCLESSEIYVGKILNVKKDKVELPNGHTSYREWVSHPGAAAIIPYFSDGKIALVKQFRYPINKITLEIPAGKFDKQGENPEECALRELNEETGLIAEKITKLATIATTVGFSNEYIHIFLGENITQGKQCPDDDEFINCVFLSLNEAIEKIQTGEIFDSKSVIALLMTRDILNKRKA